MPQDMPPVGGYRPLQFKRNLPSRGPKARWYIFGMGGLVWFGFYKYGQGVQEFNELAREKTWARLHLVPVLQAEEDRDQVRRHLADQAREKELLGKNIKVYHSDRFVKPTFAITPEKPVK